MKAFDTIWKLFIIKVQARIPLKDKSFQLSKKFKLLTATPLIHI